MKHLKHKLKKGLVFFLSLAMIAGLAPAMSGGAHVVKAATGVAPSVSAYATKEQMMDGTFAPNSTSGEAANYGKIVFGKKSDGKTQEWYILGKDNGVSGDNTIIFAASPIATRQKFNSDTSDKTYDSTTVYANHYGASDLRVALKNMATSETYFTTAEQGLMNPTTVTTKDTNNSVSYTTTDKLYALAADGAGSSYKTIKAGTNNQTVLAMSKYWSSGTWFWLRSPFGSNGNNALLARQGNYVNYNRVDYGGAVQPASNLNLSSVLFASAAQAASSDTVSNTIASETAMTLRLDGTGKNIGTVEYSATTGDIRAVQGSTSQTVALVVQGNDGTNDWYYSKQITGTETVKVSDIVAGSNTPSSIDLSTCKIWLEITDTDGLIYAVNADKEIEPINTTYVTKEQLMSSFKPNSDGTAVNIGKLVFGKNSSGASQEWYILGKDSGVSGDNTIIFAASPIATGQVFNSSTSNKRYNYGAGTGYGESAGITIVFANHYGASVLRVALQRMLENESGNAVETYFTTAEQGLMNDTTVTTKDTNNSSVTYTTTDKLYALQGNDYNNQYLWAGTSDSTVLAMSSYWSSGDWFWLRSPTASGGSRALIAWPGDFVHTTSVIGENAVQPASNLNLSSVLFASSAKAADSAADTAEKISTSSTAMTLRLDGSGKGIGTASYNTKTGDIKVAKGSTSQTVALVVQGNDGTNDWYYSKQIAEPETVNASDIKSALSLISGIDLSACKIWLEITDSTENLTYAVNATETVNSDILSVAITDIETPAPNTSLDTGASCVTEGVSSTTPQITWAPNDSKAGYNTSYIASITLTADTGYEFTDSTTATVLDNSATSVTKNANGTLTVTYAFPATAKDKLTSITAPQAITVANGTAYSAMNLPTTVNIMTEGNTVTSAPVTWNTTTPANGSYDPAILTQQTVTLNGTVACPDSIDANDSLTTTITITISAADIVKAPTANPTAGTYTENQTVALTSSTEGATIYYTTDGSEPTITGGVPGGTTQQYTAPVSVIGTEGQSITTSIKAIAVKDRMQNSSVSTFSYKIEIPDTTAPAAEIKIDTNSWNKFWNTVTFGHFFKNTKEVTITASDNVTASPTIKYYLSDNELALTEVQSDSISWTDYSVKFDINASSKKIVYAKVTDDAGNTTIVNSDGIVVYTDSAADTTAVTYVKNVTGDVTANVILNGNTVAGIKNGSSDLTNGTDYTVDGNREITFKKEYLQTLSVGIYTLTVSYNPMGESFVQGNGNETPNTTELSLTVKNPKLISIIQPTAIDGVANGTEKTAAALGLPATVTIVTEDTGITTADATWDLTNLASGSYDPSVFTEQSFTVKGTVTLPQGIDNPDKVDLNIKVSVTVIAADIVKAPTANPTAGTYTENQAVALTSSTEGATIYYTTDGSEPTITGGVPGGTTQQYTAPVSVIGTEGQSITTTIKAIAVKNGMQDSSVETFTYTIQIPVAKYTVTVTNGSGTGQYAKGETVTITAGAAPSGQQFKEWEVVSGTITLASSTSETTTFTMPAEAVSVKANYEVIPVTEYTITATAGANGSISPSGAVRVAAGGSQTFTISPSSGYVIDTLKVDSLEVTETTSYTFSDVNSNHTIEVTFKQESQTPDVTAPSITTQPGNATVKVGETATFTIVASGDNLTYQWKINRNYGNGWVNIAGATAASYTTSSVDESCNGFRYKCVVSNSAGNVESNSATLTVQDAVNSDISSVAITGIDTPAANTTLDTSAACATTGVSSTTPQITWTPSDTTAGYNTSYTASITLTADTGYKFVDSTTATINGNTATSVNKNTDGTLTVTYAFPATAKDKLTSITAPQAITVANGTAYDAMNLPATVSIVTKGSTVSSAPVTWDTTTPASGSYDPAVLTQQSVTLNGRVTCPDTIDANEVSLTTTITITISAAGIVGAPTATPAAGTYAENQLVTLTSSTNGAKIYYTTDGSVPAFTSGGPSGTTQEYREAIAVTGTEGQSVVTTIKAIAVKSGMQNSGVATFTYTIELPLADITSVAITDIDVPTVNAALDTGAACATPGVSSTTPSVTWTPGASTAGYNTSYTASVTLTADATHVFADTVAATVNGNTATSVTKNSNGTLTVTYKFDATAKAKLTSITAPQPMTVANGTAYAEMNLPATVAIVTEGNTVTSAAVTWDTTTPASGSYDPAVLTQQSVTLNGRVTCPDTIDDNGVFLTTTIDITISAAGIVGAPTANPTAGTYTENQAVTLTSSTEGATIYYTTDGSEPTITGGVPGGTTAKYTAPIAVTGTEGQSITTTIKAIAVKNDMQDSSVETFTYTIQIPVAKYTVTVTNGSGTGQYAQGETVTITAGAAPSGQQFKEWEVVSGTITLASSTSETTTFTMPAEAVSVKANYEAVPVTGYTITATAGANGSISPSGAVRVAAGGSQTFTISPSSGYVIDTLKVDGLEVTATTSYTFSEVNSNHTIEVNFKQESQTPDVTAPSITTQPGNATVKVGETATFTIAASGDNLTYQWKINRNDGNGWVNISGANAASYTTSSVDESCNGFRYKCVISNSAGTVESSTVTLTVQDADSSDNTYQIIEGANSSWTHDSDGNIAIRGNGDFSKFVGVKVDGALIDRNNYTATEGSTIITLKDSYLNTLSVGTHTFEIFWTDGSAGTTFTLSANTNDNDSSETDNDNGGSASDDSNDGTSDSQAAADSSAAATSVPAYVTHIVQKGDTLGAIARKYGCTVAEIKMENNNLIKNINLIYPGWLLKIPQNNGNAVSGGSQQVSVSPNAGKTRIHVVKRGENLWAISRKYGCTGAEIIALNSRLKANPNLLYAGWELVIPER